MSRLAATKNSRPSQIFIQRRTGSAITSASSTIRNVKLRQSSTNTSRAGTIAATTARINSSDLTTTRKISTLRLALNHSSRDRFVNRISTPVWIAKIRARHSRHPAPRLVIIPIVRPVVSTAATTTVIRMAIIIVVTIVSRMRIVLVVRQRIPADITPK